MGWRQLDILKLLYKFPANNDRSHIWLKLKERDWKIRSTKVDAGDFKHELLNRLRSTMAVNVLSYYFSTCLKWVRKTIKGGFFIASSQVKIWTYGLSYSTESCCVLEIWSSEMCLVSLGRMVTRIWRNPAASIFRNARAYVHTDLTNYMDT